MASTGLCRYTAHLFTLISTNLCTRLYNTIVYNIVYNVENNSENNCENNNENKIENNREFDFNYLICPCFQPVKDFVFIKSSQITLIW